MVFVSVIQLVLLIDAAYLQCSQSFRALEIF